MNNHQLNSKHPISRLASVGYSLLFLALLLFGGSAFAASNHADITAGGDYTVAAVEPLTAEELGDLVAPIALYPDDLLAIVLPASTYPLQIVQAARFLAAREKDSTLEPEEEWDDSIIALLNYPEVIELLNDDLDWTWRLGEAVLVQEDEVITAMSDFRERARIAGNLESDEHQIVEVDDTGIIEIKPADPQVIYVPYYEPAQVTIYQRYPVYHYYPRAYPVYYYPYPAGYTFSPGFFWGVTSAFSIGWTTQNLHLHHYGYYGHPYYNYRYYDSFYYRHPERWLSYDYNRHYNRHYDRHRKRNHNRRNHTGNRWQPDHERAGARPRNRHHNIRDWRTHRRSEHGQVNRRREHLATEGRMNRRDRPRTEHRQRTPDGRPGNARQRPALASKFSREDSARYSPRQTRSASRERHVSRVAQARRNTPSSARRTGNRQQATFAAATARPTGNARSFRNARSHGAQPERHARVETARPASSQNRRTTPTRARSQSHAQSNERHAFASASNNHAAPRRNSGGHRAANRGSFRRH